MSVAKQILDLNRFDAGKASSMPPVLAERVQRRQATFGAASVLFYEQPIEMARGEGAYLYDTNGTRYLDVYNNVPSVGHCHPRVVAAIAAQAATLNTNTRYLVRIVETYAERLLATFPAPLCNLVMTCTGSEANDVALRIAENVTGARGFIVTKSAYHGNTSAVEHISPSSFKSQNTAPHVRTVPAPDPRDAPDADIGMQFAAQIQAAIDDLRTHGHGFAGFFADSIFSSDGIFADPPGFLQQAAALIRKEGGLFVADEVQPGFGRTGAGMWGFARHGIIPDIVTMGKPMGNGFPMGGVVTSPDHLAAFTRKTSYFNTFGGNPVAAAAGLAVLDVIADENLIANAAQAGGVLKDGLLALKSTFGQIGDVRGAGLFIGLDFNNQTTGAPDPAMASYVINAMKQHGILIGAAGLYGHTLKIRPPLCFNTSNAAFFVETLRTILSGAN
ncbi:MAG: aspartate aminotransferase family protein [Acidocella sp. 20-57-95]|nr:MAG: aspartate aminotransferase family protein [Acidocella sp. 20-57-95]HQT63885.1 aminotransferase class III-fold pyridoxal phosphate-dependent enzyme [Acidocella sp.]HQU05174.1 aminotransferase class III-fold pyridoxal phosphate-dependent enzyme [Acidocella sp.]